MKTTAEKSGFPTTKRLFVFIILISGLAFASCLVSQAQVYYNIYNNVRFLEGLEEGHANVIKSGTDLSELTPDQVWEYRLKSALVEEPEADVELESWMVPTEMLESADPETELRLEEWMTWYYGSSLSFLIVEPEPELELEDWMLDVEYFIQEPAVEDPVELEEWMIEY
jgi:hypothetical protein